MRININFDKTFQKYEGIGASGAWWSQIVGGWDCIDQNGKEIRDAISALLYSRDKGIGMNIYRRLYKG